MAANTEPKTLREAVIYFSDPDNCLNFLAGRRWPNGEVVCPRCGSKNVGFIASRRVWQCKTRHPLAQFSIKVGTIFEDSPLGLDKWLPAMWLIASNRNGIRSWELHRSLGVTQKTAWFMLHRIRLAMQDEFTGGNLAGEVEVEVDETFIGGKVRNMHKARNARVQMNSQKGDKAIVLGMLERGGKVRASVVPNRKKDTRQEAVRGNVEPGAELHTDEFATHWRMDEEYAHMILNHLSTYVDGNVHTNGVENFWSCLKRTIGGDLTPNLGPKESRVPALKSHPLRSFPSPCSASIKQIEHGVKATLRARLRSALTPCPIRLQILRSGRRKATKGM